MNIGLENIPQVNLEKYVSLLHYGMEVIPNIYWKKSLTMDRW